MVLAIATNAKSTDEERDISLIQRKLARMYALLHDIPHVPFGHTIEDELGLFIRHDKNPARIEHFLGPNSEVGMIIQTNESPEFYDRLMAIYLWEDDIETKDTRVAQEEWATLRKWLHMSQDDALVHDIVSNTVCADLLDYVARDNYFCNLGMSHEYRFINYLYLRSKPVRIRSHDSRPEDSHPKRRVFVRLWKVREDKPRRDLLTDLTHLMDARYMIAERAYFHHAKLVTGAMLGRALQEYHVTEENESYLYDSSDDSLLRKLCDWERENGRVHEDKSQPLALATLLTKRTLHRTVAVYGDAAFEGAQDSFHGASLKSAALEKLRDPQSRRDAENWYAKILGRRPGSVLIYAPSPKMNVKIAQVNIQWRGQDKTLSELDDPVVKPRLKTVQMAHESLWSIRLMADRDLEQEEVFLLREAFELDFLVPEGEERARRLQHASQVLKRGLGGATWNIAITPASYDAEIRKGAESLLATARSRDAIEQLEDIIRRLEEELQTDR